MKNQSILPVSIVNLWLKVHLGSAKSVTIDNEHCEVPVRGGAPPALQSHTSVYLLERIRL